MKKGIQYIVIVILMLLLLFACTSETEPVPVSGLNPEREQTSALSISDSEQEAKPDEWQRVKVTATLKDIGLCISEIVHIGELEKFSSRLDDYKELGINTIRMGVTSHSYNYPKDAWEMTDHYVQSLSTLSEKGFTIKFMPHTISAPPWWLINKEGAQLIDETGRTSRVFVISYWYEVIIEHNEQALRAQLEELRKHNLLHIVSAIHVDLGMFGEAMFPSLLDFGYTHDNAPEGNLGRLWWFADNAVADFRAKMIEKYITIENANKAWSTDYNSFDEVTTLREGEATGKLWEDMLTWYVQTIQIFADKQTEMFRRVVDEYYENMTLILALHGGTTSKTDWNKSVKNGIATTFIRTGHGPDHLNYLVDVAYKHGAIIQQSGLESPDTLVYALNYMHETGKYITVFGENAPAEFHSDGTLLYGEDNSPRWVVDQIIKYGLVGFDFMTGDRLYERDGITKNEWFYELEENMDLLRYAISNPVVWAPPDNTGNPEGDVLRYDINFETVNVDDWAYVNNEIATINYIINEGDVFEYDVKFSPEIAGIGGINVVIDGEPFGLNFLIIDQNNISWEPFRDLTEYAYEKWYNRRLCLSNPDEIGKMITTIELIAGPGVSSEYSNVHAVIWYDNIRITNNGEVRLVIFESREDINLSRAGILWSKNVASAKVSIVDVNDIP